MNAGNEKRKNPHPPLWRMFYCVVIAVVIFVVELFLFGAIAKLFNAPTDFDKMTTLWQAGFVATFFIPGVFLIFGFINFILAIQPKR